MVSQANGADALIGAKRRCTKIQKNGKTYISPYFIVSLVVHHFDGSIHRNLLSSIHNDNDTDTGNDEKVHKFLDLSVEN